MDLNVQNDVPWTLNSGPYEFADHCAARSAHLVILLNAWLDSRENEDESEDWRVLNYWAMRLRPLWAKKDTDDVSERSERVVAVICNRTGEENGKRVLYDTARG
jgi:protein N-terminal amidase